MVSNMGRIKDSLNRISFGNKQNNNVIDYRITIKTSKKNEKKKNNKQKNYAYK